MRILPSIKPGFSFTSIRAPGRLEAWIGKSAASGASGKIRCRGSDWIRTYDFTFTGNGGMDATGTIGIQDGVAQIGSINVTGVPVEASPATLVSAAGSLLPASGATDARNHDGDVITFDNLVNLANDPIVNSDGLGFGSGQYGSQNYNTVINLWGNSPGSYSLFVGEAQVDGNGNVIGDAQYVYHWENGALTLTGVPEPATLSLLVLGSLAMFRRNRK
jgi:hypothetical protein